MAPLDKFINWCEQERGRINSPTVSTLPPLPYSLIVLVIQDQKSELDFCKLIFSHCSPTNVIFFVPCTCSSNILQPQTHLKITHKEYPSPPTEGLWQHSSSAKVTKLSYKLKHIVVVMAQIQGSLQRYWVHKNPWPFVHLQFPGNLPLVGAGGEFGSPKEPPGGELLFGSEANFTTASVWRVTQVFK